MIPEDAYPNVPVGELMTTGQMHTLTVLERTGGSLSLIGVLAIFIAYGLFPRIRNVQNTFIMFASIANIGACIASLIAMDGLIAGQASAKCQAQAFMFEMFMQSDPWWALAMSINVFLVFFMRTSPDVFQKYLWLYCVICYGGPFIIALALLLVRNEERGLVYGEATIWCWVDREWDDIRIWTYYLLIWICIIGSLLCYTLVGWQVFRTRNQLHSISTNRSYDDDRDENENSTRPRKTKLSGMLEDGYWGTVTTEVKVTRTEPGEGSSLVIMPALPVMPAEPSRAQRPATSSDDDSASDPNNSNLSRFNGAPHCEGGYMTTITTINPDHVKSEPKGEIKDSRLDLLWDATKSLMKKFVVHDKIKSAYLRTSFLFALSVLVTWIPSSMNRIQSWVSGESPFEYHVATAAVLPLQGLWNAVIFFVTSGSALSKGWEDLQKIYNEAGRGRHGIIAVMKPPKPNGQDAAAAAAKENNGMSAGGIGLTMSRRAMPRDDLDSSSDGGDNQTLNSDVELRRMAEAPGKRSSSMTSV